jgi:DNA invertase Pin-like site-specific DNA recombinase
MARAAIYARISQDREGAGLGVQRQVEDCRRTAIGLGYEIAGIYTDNDVSAYTDKPRPDYDRLLGDIRAGSIEAVVCWHIDRLTRSPRELETFIDVAGQIPTHTVQAGALDLTTATGRLTARIAGVVARHESEHKSERQRRKAEELAGKGLPLGGGRPFGYEADGMTIRESEAAELRDMVVRVLAGDSLASILRDLNARGVLTTRGGSWRYSSLRALLLRARNCGRMQHRGKVVGVAAWDPIISETQHDAVAAMLADPGRRTSPGPARRHLLSGLARCAECGAGMKPGWVPTRKREKHRLYLCPSKLAGHPSRAMSRVDNYVIEQALRYLDVVYRDAPASDMRAFEDERDELRARQREAAGLYAAGRINADQLAAITEHVETRLAEISQALSEASIESHLPGHSGFTRAEFDALSLDRKRKLIDTVVTIEVAFVYGSRDRLGVTVTPRLPHGRFGFTMPRAITETLRGTMGPLLTG